MVALHELLFSVLRVGGGGKQFLVLGDLGRAPLGGGGGGRGVVLLQAVTRVSHHLVAAVKARGVHFVCNGNKQECLHALNCRRVFKNA